MNVIIILSFGIGLFISIVLLATSTTFVSIKIANKFAKNRPLITFGILSFFGITLLFTALFAILIYFACSSFWGNNGGKDVLFIGYFLFGLSLGIGSIVSMSIAFHRLRKC